MHPFPEIPPIEEAPAALLEGHLWVQELVDGAPLRFQVQPSGLIQFGDRTRCYEDPAEIPPAYHHAIAHVRDNLDRAALQAALPDVSAVVFYGAAMHRHTIDYDWEQTPSFLGFDVWSGGREAFLSPDAVDTIFDRLNLRAVPALERELPARDFDPPQGAFPESALYDGPVKGVVIRNKRGHRARSTNPALAARDPPSTPDEPLSTVVANYANEERFERYATELAVEDQLSVEALTDRLMSAIVRREYATLFDGHDSFDIGAFRSAVAALSQSFLEEWHRSQGGT